MKLSALLKGIETKSGFEDVEIERVTDKCEEDLKSALFICIDGNRTDGHLKAEKALSNGAAAVVTERDLRLAKQIIVENTRWAYSVITANLYGNPADELKLIGVTGTNGKTSTSFFIREMLESLGKKCGLIGTVKTDDGEEETESALTTPEPPELQRAFRKMADSGCEYCVMEVSSQALSQCRVCGLVFECSVLTNITPEHLDYHGSMQDYINAKLRLFDMSKKAVVNADDENSRLALSRMSCPAVTCSAVSDSADYTAKNVVCSEKGVRYELVGMDCISRMTVGIPGKFTVYNSLSAASALIELGFDIDLISEAAKRLESVRGRAETVFVPADFTVMIDYAHTPDGLRNILSCVREFTGGRLITVFGCGGDRDRAKRAEMGRIAGELSDLAIVTSDNPRTENPLLIINDILCGMENTKAKTAVAENRRDAINYALKKAKKGDLVLLAGKGHETYQIIGNEKKHFDEREIVREFFK